MRATAIRLVRIVPRTALQTSEVKIIPRPTPQYEDLRKPTTLQLLLKQKEEAGQEWPANIRIEPVVKKAAFKKVSPEIRPTLKKLFRET